MAAASAEQQDGGTSCLTGPFNKGHEQPGPFPTQITSLIIQLFILILSDTDLPDNVWAESIGES